MPKEGSPPKVTTAFTGGAQPLLVPKGIYSLSCGDIKKAMSVRNGEYHDM